MLALRLLGGLALENPDGVPLGRAAQRRRLALLAVLASPVGVRVAREKLVGLLWPEVPPDDARHRLSVALYDLRQALGDDAITISTHGITLVPCAIVLDVADFASAIARQDWEAAAALYAGPFLDGIYLLNAPQFEQWVDERRAELARAATRALEMLAAERARRGNRDGAVEAWRRLTRLDPYSARFAAGLMRALDAAGDRTGALRHAVIHAELLRADLDAEPAGDVEELAAELKQTPARPPSLPSTTAETTTAAPEVVEEPLIVPRRNQRHRWATVALMLALLLLLPAALRIFPAGAPQRAGLAHGTSTRAVREFREGELHMRSGRFEAAVAAFERSLSADSTFARAHFQLAVATLWADQPGARVDVQLARATAHRDALDALDRVLLDGFVAWRRGEWSQAEALYRRALVIDPTSIEARHQLGETLFHYNAPQGRPTSESYAEFERVLAREPRHFGALWHLAQLASRAERTDDVAKLTRQLLALEPDAVRRLEVEVLRAAALADTVAFDELLERLRGADESLLFGTGWRLAVFGRRLDAAESVFELLTDSARGPYARGLGHTQLLYLDIARGRTAEASARLRALTALRDPGVTVVWPALLFAAAPGLPFQADMLRSMRDSLTQVLANETSIAGNTARVIDARTALGWIHALLGDAELALATADRLEHDARKINQATPELASWAVGRAASIRALRARHAGHADAVIRYVDSSLSYRWFGDALAHPLRAYSMERYLRAEALLALGRTQEADSWFATIGEHDPSDLVFLAPALLRRAEINRLRIERASGG